MRIVNSQEATGTKGDVPRGFEDCGRKRLSSEMENGIGQLSWAD